MGFCVKTGEVGLWEATSRICHSITVLILIKGAAVLIALKLSLAISLVTLDGFNLY